MISFPKEIPKKRPRSCFITQESSFLLHKFVFHHPVPPGTAIPANNNAGELNSLEQQHDTKCWAVKGKWFAI